MKMNKEIMRAAGFGKEVDAVEAGVCPLCGNKIDVATEFKDDLSREEYAVSGMCQSCQDDVFAIEGEATERSSDFR
jgi:hypothetical protein